MSAPLISGVPKGVSKRKVLKERRIEKAKAPKVYENDKLCMVMNGKNSSGRVKEVLKELVSRIAFGAKSSTFTKG